MNFFSKLINKFRGRQQKGGKVEVKEEKYQMTPSEINSAHNLNAMKNNRKKKNRVRRKMRRSTQQSQR